MESFPDLRPIGKAELVSIVWKYILLLQRFTHGLRTRHSQCESTPPDPPSESIGLYKWMPSRWSVAKRGKCCSNMALSCPAA